MGEVLAVNPVQRDVIALCRETLREAEAGTLSGVVILGTYSDGMLSRSEAGDVNYAETYVQMDLFKYELLSQCLDDESE